MSEQRTCPQCQSVFSVMPSRPKKCCSNTCARKLNWSVPSYKNMMSDSHKGMVGTFTGRKHSKHSITKMRAVKYDGKELVLRNTGYYYRYEPGHPRAINGRIPNSVAVMESSIGRLLRPYEVVHHINLIKTDDRLENLLLCTKREHKSIHMKLRWQERRAA